MPTELPVEIETWLRQRCPKRDPLKIQKQADAFTRALEERGELRAHLILDFHSGELSENDHRLDELAQLEDYLQRRSALKWANSQDARNRRNHLNIIFTELREIVDKAINADPSSVPSCDLRTAASSLVLYQVTHCSGQPDAFTNAAVLKVKEAIEAAIHNEDLMLQAKLHGAQKAVAHITRATINVSQTALYDAEVEISEAFETTVASCGANDSEPHQQDKDSE